ncbi:hypothetical protein D3C86_1560850 [compost metagenome]
MTNTLCELRSFTGATDITVSGQEAAVVLAEVQLSNLVELELVFRRAQQVFGEAFVQKLEYRLLELRLQFFHQLSGLGQGASGADFSNQVELGDVLYSDRGTQELHINANRSFFRVQANTPLEYGACDAVSGEGIAEGQLVSRDLLDQVTQFQTRLVQLQADFGSTFFQSLQRNAAGRSCFRGIDTLGVFTQAVCQLLVFVIHFN